MGGPIKLENLDKDDLQTVIKSLKSNEAIFMKFTADWCAPCKTIKSECDQIVALCSPNIYYVEIDVDESIELFSFFKNKKLLKGIPALYLYYGDSKERDEKWYLPDYSVLGADKGEVHSLFAQLSKYIIIPEEQG